VSQFDPRIGGLVSLPHSQGVGQGRRQEQIAPAKAADTGFAEVLREKLAAAGLELSAHAQRRLTSRGIRLDEQRTEKIGEVVELLASKGAREALLVLEDGALVVSVRARKVITALSLGDLRERVVTGIDAAAFVEVRGQAKGVDAAQGSGLPAGGATEPGPPPPSANGLPGQVSPPGREELGKDH